MAWLALAAAPKAVPQQNPPWPKLAQRQPAQTAAASPCATYKTAPSLRQSGGQHAKQWHQAPSPQPKYGHAPHQTSAAEARRASQPPPPIADYSKERSFERSQSQHHPPQPPPAHFNGADRNINRHMRKAGARQRLRPSRGGAFSIATVAANTVRTNIRKSCATTACNHP